MFEDCLYFNLSSLTRKVTEAWRIEFAKLGLSPSHGYLLFAMAQNEGLEQKQYGEHLDLDSSTINRFIDTLISKGLVEKTGIGRGSSICLTTSGKREQTRIHQTMSHLKQQMVETLGEKRFTTMVQDIATARKSFS